MDSADVLIRPALGIVATALILMGIGVATFCDDSPKRWIPWLVTSLAVFGLSVLFFLVNLVIHVGGQQSVVVQK